MLKTEFLSMTQIFTTQEVRKQENVGINGYTANMMMHCRVAVESKVGCSNKKVSGIIDIITCATEPLLLT